MPSPRNHKRSSLTLRIIFALWCVRAAAQAAVAALDIKPPPPHTTTTVFRLDRG